MRDRTTGPSSSPRSGAASEEGRVPPDVSGSPRGTRKSGAGVSLCRNRGLLRPLLASAAVYSTVLATVTELWRRRGAPSTAAGASSAERVPEAPTAEAEKAAEGAGSWEPSIAAMAGGLVGEYHAPPELRGKLLALACGWRDVGTEGIVGDQRKHNSLAGLVSRELRLGGVDLRWQEVFVLELRGGRRVLARECRLSARTVEEDLSAYESATVVSRQALWLECPGGIAVQWSAVLLRTREDGEALRTRLVFHGKGVERLSMWAVGSPAGCPGADEAAAQLPAFAPPAAARPGAAEPAEAGEQRPCFQAAGGVDGSPLVDPALGAWLAMDHPRAQHSLAGGALECWLAAPSAGVAYFASLGAAGAAGAAARREPEDAFHLLRRHFGAYLGALRSSNADAHLFYDSRYDLRRVPCKDSSPLGAPHCKAAEPLNEQRVLDRLLSVHRELSSRGIPLDGLLLDDGWDSDDGAELWQAHPENFPLGLAPLCASATARGVALGVWLSPWGGFGESGSRRLQLGAKLGLEISDDLHVFRLAAPRYGAVFRNVTRELALRVGARFFRLDGFGEGLEASGARKREMAEDVDRLLALVAEVRQDVKGAEPGAGKLWFTASTGSWPSPFWLTSVNSVWRGGPDLGRRGEGSVRQQWITFRDAMVYSQVVQRAPLFPLSGLSLGGVVWSSAEEPGAYLASFHLEDLKSEARSFFLSGSTLQELLIMPSIMNSSHWDAIASAANVSRRYADVLRDAHWAGGNPAAGEPYGYAAYGCDPCRGVLFWRNPRALGQNVSFTLRSALGIPKAWTGGSADGRWQVLPLWQGPAPERAPSHPGAESAAEDGAGEARAPPRRLSERAAAAPSAPSAAQVPAAADPLAGQAASTAPVGAAAAGGGGAAAADVAAGTAQAAAGVAATAAVATSASSNADTGGAVGALEGAAVQTVPAPAPVGFLLDESLIVRLEGFELRAYEVLPMVV